MDGLTPLAWGRTNSARELRVTCTPTRANSNTKDTCFVALTDSQFREVYTLMLAKAPPRVDHAERPLDLADDDGEKESHF